MIIYYRFYLIGVCWCELVKFGREFGKNIFKLELILLCQLGGGDNGWKKTAIITVFVVLLWILPIYAMDYGNTTTNLSVNSTGHHNQTLNDSGGDQDLHNQIMVLKSAPSGKYKDVQDLHLRILQILEEMRLLRQENETARSVRYYLELETQSSELESLMRSIIRG